MKRFYEMRWILERKALLIKGGVIALIAIAALAVFLTGGQGAGFVEVPAEGGSPSGTQDGKGQEEPAVEKIIVDVAGAVRHPDVVELPAGSRVEDAVDAAGGLLANADARNVNRAAVLEDGEKVYIPFMDEGSGDEGGASGQGGGLINLNTADAALLESLPGIGPATAAKIIQYRNETGLFKKTEDLMNVSGIGPATFAEIEPLIGI